MSARCCIPFAALFLVAAQPPAKGGGQKDRDKLQGEWSVVSVKHPAGELNPEIAKKRRLIVTGDEWEMVSEDGSKSKFRFKLDPSRNPKEIDFTPKDKDVTMKGVYQLEGETLTICHASPEAARPKQFQAGENWVLIVFKRVAK